tara:strand:- start:14 stop:1021 length:1008 start_codon:yes stop_codon:yes gene_type:complete
MASALSALLMPKDYALANEDVSCQKNEPKTDREHYTSIREAIEKNQIIPDTLKEKVFWGHRAVNLDDSFLSVPGLFFPAFSMLSAIKSNKWRTEKREIVESCGITSLNNVSLNSAEIEKVDELKYHFESVREDVLRHLPESERFYTIVNTLFSSFRDTDYLTTELGGLDPTKTLPHLLNDGEGDCEDFALARYQMGVELGLNPDHLMLVFYKHRDKDASGHANLSIYDQYEDRWLIVDGTGRANGYAVGGTIAYENSQVVMDRLNSNGNYLGRTVPYLGVTRKGLVVFNTFDENKEIRPAEKMIDAQGRMPLLATLPPLTEDQLRAHRGQPSTAP